MTSHVHMIIGALENKPENVMRDFKKHSSEKLKEAIMSNQQESRKEWLLGMIREAGRRSGQHYRFWQEGNHPIELSSPRIVHQKLDYIHDNPVVLGIVEKPEDYLYSSARDYFGRKGLIDVQILDPLIV